MASVDHPLVGRAAPTPAAVTGPDGATYPVRDGTIECPGDVADALRTAWADRYDWYDAAPTVETCTVEKADGEVCGRERPCRYHD